MTTTVTVQAHCNDDTEVLIQTVENGAVMAEVYIKNGDQHVVYAYSTREIRVSEVPNK